MEWRDSEGFTILQLAAFAGDPDVVSVLVKAKANVDAQNDDGNTALHCELALVCLFMYEYIYVCMYVCLKTENSMA